MINYDGSSTEAARLSFASGIFLQMDYGARVQGQLSRQSSAHTRDAANVFLNDLEYGSARYLSAPIGIWTLGRSKAIANITKGFPVQLGIRGDAGGHSIIAEGYDDINDTFLLNMGWGGYEDNWYSLPNFDAGSYWDGEKFSDIHWDIVHTIVYDINPSVGWNQVGSDSRNSFSTPYSGPENVTQNKWRYEPGSSHSMAGLVIGRENKIYASEGPRSLGGSDHPRISILSQYGTLVKRISLTEENSNITIPAQNPADGKIFVGTGSGFIYRVDPKTDAATLIYSDPGSVEFGTVKLDTNNYLYATADDKLVRMNGSGSVQWTFVPPSGGKMYRGAPAIDEGRNNVYVGWYNSSQQKAYLGCINRQTGSLKYSQQFDNILVSSRMTGLGSLGTDGTVFVGCYTNFYALTPGASAFSVAWTRNFRSNTGSQAPAIGPDGTVYLTHWKVVGSTWYFALSALNPATGSTKWEWAERSSPDDYDNILQPYVTADKVVIFSIQAENGSSADTFDLYAIRDLARIIHESCGCALFLGRAA